MIKINIIIFNMWLIILKANEHSVMDEKSHVAVAYFSKLIYAHQKVTGNMILHFF